MRRPVGTRFNDCYTQSYGKTSSKCHDLGAMSDKGIAILFFLPIGTTMNGDRYRKILEDKLKINIAIHESNMFMQDSAPCHRSKLVSDIPKKKNIKALDWPGNITDRNPIKNLWAIVIKTKWQMNISQVLKT